MNPGDEPAFPCRNDDQNLTDHPGLTKRELFAAMAMQGDWACPKDAAEIQTKGQRSAAKTYCQMADALLAELAKPQEETK